MFTCRTKNNLPFQTIFLKYAKSCEGDAIADFRKYNCEFFHRDSLIMAKYFSFLGILVTLTVLKLEFRKRE